MKIWYYYSLTFGEDKVRERYGCLEACKESLELLNSDFLPVLKEHKDFISEFIKEKVDYINKADEKNKSIYYATPIDPKSLPPVNPVPFSPSLEFIPSGYKIGRAHV